MPNLGPTSTSHGSGSGSDSESVESQPRCGSLAQGSLPTPVITRVGNMRRLHEEEEAEDDSESNDVESCDAISKAGHDDEPGGGTQHASAERAAGESTGQKAAANPSPASGLAHCNNKKSKVRHRRLGQVRWYHFRSCASWSIWSASSLEGRAARLLLVIAFLMSPGIICHYLWPDLTIDRNSILYWSTVITFVLTGFFVLKFLIQLFLFTCHRSSAFAIHSHTWLYHLTGCKGYVAFFLYVAVLAVIWNVTPLHDTDLWHGHTSDGNKVFFTLAIAIITFAYKNHLVNSMAMSFNYANYIERIQDTLFADTMLHALLKSKHVYRIKRRLWLQLQAQQQAATLSLQSHGWRRSGQRDQGGAHQSVSATLASHSVTALPPTSGNYLTFNSTRLASFFTDPSRRWGAGSAKSPGPACSVLKTVAVSPESSYSDMPQRPMLTRSSDTSSLVDAPTRPSGHARSQSSRHPMLTAAMPASSRAGPASDPFLSALQGSPHADVVAIDMRPFSPSALDLRQSGNASDAVSPISTASEPLPSSEPAGELKPDSVLPADAPAGPAPAQADAVSVSPAPEAQFNPYNVQRELLAFHKLAQRLVAQFEATARSASAEPSVSSKASSVSHDSGIRREACILSKKLYKWLLPVDVVQIRTSLIKADFSEIIENPSDLDRLWTMLAFRQQEQALKPQPQSHGIQAESPRDAAKEAPFFHGSSSGSYGRDSSPVGLLKHSSSATRGPVASIQQAHLTDFIERSYREVISLSKSLGSMEAAVKKLSIFFSILCMLVLLIFMALFFGQFSDALVHITSVLIGTAFVFGSTGKNLFESMIFLFVMHPFDVGDRIYVCLSPASGPAPPISLPGGGALLTNATPASGSLENLVVLEMNLITTVFERWDGAKIYVPNYVLANKPIINIRRSGALNEIHRLQFDFRTPVSKLNELRRRLVEFLKREAADYTDEIIMNVELIENLNRMHILIMVQHRTNWQDFEAQLNRKSKILMFFKEAVESLGISYTPPVQRVEVLPSYDAAISSVQSGIGTAS